MQQNLTMRRVFHSYDSTYTYGNFSDIFRQYADSLKILKRPSSAWKTLNPFNSPATREPVQAAQYFHISFSEAHGTLIALCSHVQDEFTSSPALLAGLVPLLAEPALTAVNWFKSCRLN